MNTCNARDQWDNDATDVFVTYGEAFVPYRQEQYKTICGLLPESHPYRVVELCCGEGKLCRVLLEGLPQATLQACDGSEVMLQKARANLAEFGNRFQADLFDVHNHNWRKFSPPVNAFVSSLALHHLTLEEKPGFYRDLYDSLAPGGIFVNADLVWPLSAEGRSVAADAWDRWVKHFSEESNDGGAAYRAFVTTRWNLFRHPEENEGDHPLPITQECDLLAKAGFSQVDSYWMYAGHAIFGGRKL
ncbi:MAG TPA: methyltransferase domain-containing protein [Terriglobales bacterium]|jgi:tRNA (cmo5U34)-methyltransferase|nr:methyltransferase domain-containing protein [Terriglobales bacterium]